MDVVDRWQERLGASPAELLGLLALVGGGLAVLGLLLWWRPAGDGGVAGHEYDRGEVVALEPATVVVHVSGAVGRPGIVTLPGGSRVHDAITAAGGAGADADLATLNLARILADGEQVHVPLIGETSARATVRADGRVDLNRADAAALEALPGIGPALAQRIIAWRDANGPFTSAGQLREVSGIGERVFQGLADLVVV